MTTPNGLQPSQGNEMATTPALDALKTALVVQAQGFNPVPVIVEIIHPAAQFMIQGMNNQPRLTGVMLASKKVRVMYPRNLSESDKTTVEAVTNGRPICSSTTYMTGEFLDLTQEELDKLPEVIKLLKDQVASCSGKCPACPLDTWGSEALFGREGATGKACQEKRRVLYWQPGIKIPIIMNIPSTSVRAFDAYCSSLAANNKSHFEAITEINLELHQRGEYKWSQMKFRMDSPLTEAVAKELITTTHAQGIERSLFQMLIDVFNAREIGADEVDVVEDGLNGTSSQDAPVTSPNGDGLQSTPDDF